MTAATLGSTTDAERLDSRQRRRHEFSRDIKLILTPLQKDRNNWRGLLALTQDATFIAGAVALPHYATAFFPLAIFLIGTRQRALATLLHEASHQTLARNRTLNTGIGMVAGWLIGQSFFRYRRSHVGEHHPYLGDETRDPDTMNYIRQGLFDAAPRSFLRDHVMPIMIGAKTWANLHNLLRDRLLPTGWDQLPIKAKMEYGGFITFWLALIASFVATGTSGYFLLFWILPYLTVFQAVNWIIELSEHFPLIRLYKYELEMTRNRRGGWLENLFFGIHAENWHLVHHLLPGLPFWQAAAAHKVMMRDPAYAAANNKSGGLLTRGPAGEPSIVSMIQKQLIESQFRVDRVS